MLVPVLLFLLGLALLVKGGDWFVDSSVGIARRFRIPDVIIGATVVSIGTTLPEVMVSASSALSGHGEIAYGNAVGSIICNTALISALTVAIKPCSTDKKTLRMPVLFFFGAAVFYSAVAVITGEFSRLTGILLLAIFVAYMAAVLVTTKKEELPETSDNEAHMEDTGDTRSLIKNIVFLIIGAAMIAIGADFLVDNGTLIAAALGVPEAVIALTFVALGTSLPELVTAVTSLIKGHGALSLGNIIGANLFDLVLVSGIAPALSPFTVPSSKLIAGMNSTFVIDIPVMLASMAILTLPPFFTGRVRRIHGIVLLVIYAAFCFVQFVL